MFEGLARLVRLPLARPPGRAGRLDRAAPEVSAGLVYFIWIIAYALAEFSDLTEHPAMIGAIFAYLAYWLIAMIGPPAAAAAALVGERAAGTLDAMPLAPMNSDQLPRGRFWSVTLPWLRLTAWMLPLYLTLAFNGATAVESGPELVFLSTASALGARPVFAWALFEGVGREGAHPCWSGLLMLVRVGVDVAVMLLAAATAYYVSARSRRRMPAVVLGCVLPAGVLATVASAPEWILPFLIIGGVFTGPGSHMTAALVYLAGRVLVVVGLVLATAWLLGRVSRNFDRYLLD